MPRGNRSKNNPKGGRAEVKQGRATSRGEVDKPCGSGPRREPGLGARYIPFPLALESLQGRLNATADEIAAWVLMGPKYGGLRAYLDAGEVNPPPRFFYGELDPGYGFDYLAPLMACWFDAEDVDRFSPAERFITGTDLIQRWSQKPGIQAPGFIVAKIKESRLCDLHPIFGGTRATEPHDAGLPPLEAGLFCLADVEAIEATDFRGATEKAGQTAGAAHPPVGSQEWFREQGLHGANALHDKPGGSRDKKRQLLDIWASGKYTTRDICAEKECAGLEMSFSAARRALRNAPMPKRT